MPDHANNIQENKSQSFSDGTSQLKSSGEYNSQFIDNRPEAAAQRKLQEIMNGSPQVSQLKAFQDMVNNSARTKQLKDFQESISQSRERHTSFDSETIETTTQLMKRSAGGGDPGPPRSRRASTVAASLPPSDPHGRTRGAAAAEEVREGDDNPAPPRNLATSPFAMAEDGTRLWNGFSRPSWGDIEDTFYAGQASQDGTKADGTPRVEYLCITDDGNTFLPRRRDADAGEDTASIGHRMQWRDYIAANADTGRWTVVGGGEIEAISMEEAERCYRDFRNLELQGQIYNSRIANAYTSDAPGQRWV